MTHFWLRAEQRANEERTPLMPEGAGKLLAAGHSVTVERSPNRIVPDADYEAAGCEMAPRDSWPEAPAEAVILGLKELVPDGPDLAHRHIMFGHAYKGQPDGPALLARFKRGGGTLLDLEYLTDAGGRRLAAFGYWAGYVGAAVSLITWTAQQTGKPMPSLSTWEGSNPLLADLQIRMATLGGTRPTAIIIGARGRVGTGATDLCTALGVAVTAWDMEETARGGPFPEILAHHIFLNCVLAGPGTPIFVARSALTAHRRLTVIGDIACDPGSDYNPVPLYDRATDWNSPTIRAHDTPPLDIMAVDNLPSLLPRDSSEDFAEQLLPLLVDFETHPTWPRAITLYEEHAAKAG